MCKCLEPYVRGEGGGCESSVMLSLPLWSTCTKRSFDKHSQFVNVHTERWFRDYCDYKFMLLEKSVGECYLCTCLLFCRSCCFVLVFCLFVFNLPLASLVRGSRWVSQNLSNHAFKKLIKLHIAIKTSVILFCKMWILWDKISSTGDPICE